VLQLGILSPDKEEWELIKVYMWSGRSRTVLNSSNWRRGESLEQAFARIGTDWFCPDCFLVNMDGTFNLPIRLLGRRN